MSNNNEQLAKVPCGGFQIGSGLTLSEDGKTLSVSGGGVQSDWNQNDVTAADYVKNRPGGYDENGLLTLFDNTWTNGQKRIISTEYFLTREDVIFNIKIDDAKAEDYQSVYSFNSSSGFNDWKVGDLTFSEIGFYMNISRSPLGEQYVTFYFKDGESHKCAVQTYVPIPVNIQNKYLPNSVIQNISNSSVEVATQLDSTREYKSINANKGRNALINGYHCEASSDHGQHSVLVGDNLVSKYSYLTIGVFNDTDSFGGKGAYFVIGGGTSESERRNAFAVTSEGEIIVPSSTNNSTKYFKITVDDTGAIKATEVQ